MAGMKGNVNSLGKKELAMSMCILYKYRKMLEQALG